MHWSKVLYPYFCTLFYLLICYYSIEKGNPDPPRFRNIRPQNTITVLNGILFLQTRAPFSCTQHVVVWHKRICNFSYKMYIHKFVISKSFHWLINNWTYFNKTALHIRVILNWCYCLKIIYIIYVHCNEQIKSSCTIHVHRNKIYQIAFILIQNHTLK